MSRRRVIAFASCLMVAVVALGRRGQMFAVEGPGPAKRPNVLVIITDDQGWGDLSIHGNKNLRTPNIDRLAQEGARFERFYVSPVCAPTRAEFLTGRYHPRTGVRGVTTGAERLNLDEQIVAEVFRQAGYRTAIFGKWHNGSQYPYHPLGRGFEEFYGFTSGHWGHYFSPPLEWNDTWVRGSGYLPDDLTNRAIDFFRKHQDEPVFCCLAFNTPHSPFQVPDEFYQRFAIAELPMPHHAAEEDLQATRAALAMCENIDWNVGRLRRALAELGLENRTIVVYFSDNGPNGWRWNGGLRGRKGSTDEGGCRVPCIFWWPGQIPAGMVIAEPAAAIDLAPTLVELAGLSWRPPKPVDGKSLVPLLRGESAGWPDRMILVHQNGRVSVRTREYVLDDRGRLYSLVTDPGQTRDLRSQLPAVAARLSQAVERFRQEVLPKEPDTRPFPVGYTQFPIAYLPARDGVPHGKIRRSSVHPNCSFFTGWESTDDSITWDIEVKTAGLYEATLYYTCRAEDVGAQLRLSFGESSVAATVAEAFDPPLIGAAEDRVPRSESYMKEFRPLRLGMLNLPADRGLLTLRADKIPGQRAVDVWMISLRLVSAGKN
ncbi:MAG: arylsulfatase [Thermoguttaceae bacterium]|nr:arylsulfatase [Thermoguttaceae bacterium]MDW8078303.1 arylsulfatase [Thermoguttaceae bacterium]